MTDAHDFLLLQGIRQSSQKEAQPGCTIHVVLQAKWFSNNRRSHHTMRSQLLRTFSRQKQQSLTWSPDLQSRSTNPFVPSYLVSKVQSTYFDNVIRNAGMASANKGRYFVPHASLRFYFGWLLGWLIVLHIAGNEPSSLSPWTSVVLTAQTWANSLVYLPILSSVDIKDVLPAFHVQVLKWTGDLGSNDEQAWFG